MQSDDSVPAMLLQTGLDSVRSRPWQADAHRSSSLNCATSPRIGSAATGCTPAQTDSGLPAAAACEAAPAPRRLLWMQLGIMLLLAGKVRFQYVCARISPTN